MPLPALSKGFWRTQLRQWHWISSALCLTGLLLFAATGFTLNHATAFEAKPQTTRVEKTLPAEIRARLGEIKDKAPLPADLAAAVCAATGAEVGRHPAEVEDDIFVDLPGPGVDASVTIDRDSGHVTYERTTRGVIAVLNDLHKGRNAEPVWGLFIDALAMACVLFALTGLGLLWVYARGRRITWPLAAAGLVLPLLLYLLFVHL